MILREVVQRRARLLSNLVVDAGTVQVFGDDICAGFILSDVLTVVSEVCRDSRAGCTLHPAAQSVVFVSDAATRWCDNLG